MCQQREGNSLIIINYSLTGIEKIGSINYKGLTSLNRIT